MTNSIAHHPAFSFVRSEYIDALNVSVQEFEHTTTGAKHYHIASDNDENVFLVGLKTVPTDSTGVAHILEHSVLCGSERFPVRDPFFMMIRRSLNTFMNAFTSSDWTAYPFASKNKKDYFNLLDVYLDAVFFSRLDPMDFAQEGHRLEFEEPENAESDLTFKGVVFNEMKGAMSSTTSVLWQTMTKYLFPNNTYHFNSGGEPTDIPDLSYDDLMAFYRKHYHPSNAVFMTFGDIPAETLQAQFEEKVLSRFESLDATVSVDNAKRYFAPVRVEEGFAAEEVKEDGSHVVVSWLLGESTDLGQQFEAQLLSSVLLDNSASPLRRVLENSELGQAPSPLCGLEDSNKEMSFMCGLEGVKRENAEAVEKLILDALEEVAENGVDQSMVDAMLHQLELSQREIGGGGYPYGLQLILAGLSTAVHSGDVIAQLDLDPVIDSMREKVKNTDYIPNLIRSLILSNAHRVTLTLSPDDSLENVRNDAEKARLANIKASLSEDEKQNIIDRSNALKERQEQVDDISILPKVGLEDVPASIPVYDNQSLEKAVPVTFYPQGTNGLVYQQLVIELPELTAEETAVLPTFAMLLSEVGVGDKDYLAMQSRQAEICGGLGASNSIRATLEDKHVLNGYFVISSKALVPNALAMTELMTDTLKNVRFDEAGRIKELIAQRRARRQQSITGQGHSLAMTSAASGISGLSSQEEAWGGMTGIANLIALDDSLKEGDDAMNVLVAKLTSIHSKVLSMPKQVLLVAEGHHLESLEAELSPVWQNIAQSSSELGRFTLPFVEKTVKQGWTTATQVSFCSKAFKTPSGSHPDVAPLTVLGGFLRNGYLHRVIREQGGAYGGGASFDGTAGAFRFYSYRDPRLSETLADFDQSVSWLLENDHSEEALEEAILGVIGSLDKPSSPAGEAQGDFFLQLHGREQAYREQQRKRILSVTVEDLQRVAKSYLTPENESAAVISSAANAQVLEEQGFTINNL
ncbi:peptidase M16 [Marinomonas mediterranea]|jgi:Predicted Zn-dependent peptidases, insulinase-like|uniref:Peptidase M16C associated domain protein n=1 Tax=Marinomonas mediterranea (strain ATCC 700492 / JCM 21426 / NBRC 103028 / MMB-1) TaxID=717774 RepID=F2JX65_MARM1|nr:insulinase family protein [Marinomonas mediterranea]ADZ89584.1 Peptidase M16C associated domain protein [Marinomonas mediterranea MMB-1]WCN11778.1 peptidase M16 [Marinomonas mediterranea]WCN15826.1 peptidase M16 [Marinomonas mediterranea MMB-1]